MVVIYILSYREQEQLFSHNSRKTRSVELLLYKNYNQCLVA